MAKPDETRQDVLDVLRGVVDGVKSGTVFGEPVTHNGLTVLPVARLTGGGGGGRGDSLNGRQGEGSGGGIGLSARPVGVYVIGNDEVTWSPAVDVTKVALGGQLVGIVALLTLRTLFKMVRDRQRRQQLETRPAEDSVHDQVDGARPNGRVHVDHAPGASRRLRGVRRSRRLQA
ncbi:spore germination protein GerW family protein [Kribbella sp. NPDC000426]|uniref:spore germination protein GerW family protein n=1 Tax=Kribbella sp. NPDC000426 TaxID=3154255 RepID=UPI00332255B6